MRVNNTSRLDVTQLEKLQDLVNNIQLQINELSGQLLHRANCDLSIRCLRLTKLKALLLNPSRLAPEQELTQIQTLQYSHGHGAASQQLGLSGYYSVSQHQKLVIKRAKQVEKQLFNQARIWIQGEAEHYMYETTWRSSEGSADGKNPESGQCQLRPSTVSSNESEDDNVSQGNDDAHIEEPDCFSKIPSDTDEAINEAFAGAIIETMKQKNLLTETEAQTLITTRAYIDEETRRFGLKQPMQNSATPLHQVIETTSPFGGRSVVFESMRGGWKRYSSHNYSDEQKEDLKVIIAVTLILGDYSVHSGNILQISIENENRFIKIDAGASLRNVLIPGNNTHTDLPLEYQGYGVGLYRRRISKAYHTYFDGIEGLTQDVSNFSEELQQRIDEDVGMRTIVTEALALLPAVWQMQLQQRVTASKPVVDCSDAYADALNKRITALIARRGAEPQQQEHDVPQQPTRFVGK